MWVAGRGPLALCVSGQLRHSFALLPVALCRQPHHHPRQHCHGDGVFGLPGRHQGEQVPSAERKDTTAATASPRGCRSNCKSDEDFSFLQFFIVLLVILLAELILLILFFVYTDKVKQFYLKMSSKLLVSIKVEFYTWI